MGEGKIIRMKIKFREIIGNFERDDKTPGSGRNWRILR